MKRVCALFMSFWVAMYAVAVPMPPPETSSDDLTQGLWWLYHLRYEQAITLYNHHITEHPDDPAGYFYKAAADWWHLAQEFEYPHPAIEKRFYESVDQTIEKAQARVGTLNSSDPVQAREAARAYLYWGGAEGLRGRFLVAQKHWANAYFSGREGYNRLRQAVKLDPELYDAYMGLGIYDYFSDTLSGFMGFLAAIFVRGDRKKGIRELEIAIQKSPHARVEAQVFLTEIYTFEENAPALALPMTESLRKEFPASPLMHLLKITALYQSRQWDRVEKEAADYYEKSTQESPWYSAAGRAPALYCLAMADLWGKRDPENALKKLNRIFNDTTEDNPNRWISFAHLRRGQIYDLQNKRAEAIAEYQQVLARPATWGSHNEATKYLKTPFIKLEERH